MIKTLSASVMLALVTVFGSACIVNDIEGGDASHKFYAAVAQYDAAKVHAVEFVRSPAVTLETAEKILNITKAADAEIAVVLEEIRVNGVTADGFAAAEAAVRVALARLMLEIEIPAGGVI